MTDADESQTLMSVRLVPAALKALHDAAQLTEMNRTTVVNRALQVYAAMVEVGAVGGRQRLDVRLLGDDDYFEVIVERV